MRLALIGFTARGCQLVNTLMGRLGEMEGQEQLPEQTESGAPERMSKAGGTTAADGMRSDCGRAIVCRGFCGGEAGREQGLERVAGGTLAWAGERFRDSDAIIFVGAAGIAVRMIAPWVKSKTTDPAVLVMDERGRFVISLLSGHIGGANGLARRIAALMGSTPVITTATDVNGLFAVDEFAAKNDLAIESMALAKRCAVRLLAGERVGFRCELPVDGVVPPELTMEMESGKAAAGEGDCGMAKGKDSAKNYGSGAARTEMAGAFGILVSPMERRLPWRETLRLIPRCVYVGVGCRRGKPREAIEAAVLAALAKAGVSFAAVAAVASIDRKADEAGILDFCRIHHLPYQTYSSEALLAVDGDFSASPFVEHTVGVDNVCERSAICAGGERLLVRKQAADGVTVAVAIKERRVRFEE